MKNKLTRESHREQNFAPADRLLPAEEEHQITPSSLYNQSQRSHVLLWWLQRQSRSDQWLIKNICCPLSRWLMIGDTNTTVRTRSNRAENNQQYFQ